MRLRFAAVIGLWLFPVTVSFVEAQQAPRGLVEVEERRRSGFWLAASLGAGRESFDVDDDGAGRRRRDRGSLRRPPPPSTAEGMASQRAAAG